MRFLLYFIFDSHLIPILRLAPRASRFALVLSAECGCSERGHSGATPHFWGFEGTALYI
jgi:hypothetical protein